MLPSLDIQRRGFGAVTQRTGETADLRAPAEYFFPVTYGSPGMAALLACLRIIDRIAAPL
jgi:hypothetical protein